MPLRRLYLGSNSSPRKIYLTIKLGLEPALRVYIYFFNLLGPKSWFGTGWFETSIEADQRWHSGVCDLRQEQSTLVTTRLWSDQRVGHHLKRNLDGARREGHSRHVTSSIRRQSRPPPIPKGAKHLNKFRRSHATICYVEIVTNRWRLHTYSSIVDKRLSQFHSDAYRILIRVSILEEAKTVFKTK